jgi:hypothetical protein
VFGPRSPFDSPVDCKHLVVHEWNNAEYLQANGIVYLLIEFVGQRIVVGVIE